MRAKRVIGLQWNIVATSGVIKRETALKKTAPASSEKKVFSANHVVDFKNMIIKWQLHMFFSLKAFFDDRSQNRTSNDAAGECKTAKNRVPTLFYQVVGVLISERC